jgi:hypothetical protein
MTDYTYTLSPPSTDIQENLRLGYRTPRSILLPPYLAANPYFTEYMDAIDEVFEPLVDQKTEILGDLRNMWVTNPSLEGNEIANSEMIDFSRWSQPERALLAKQVNALGMNFQNAGVISDDSYQAISRWVGQYWFAKGTQSFIDFINYSLSSELKVTPLWTQDYSTFVPEGDPSIGTPIWEGGPWYPTSHVSIIASGGLQSLDIKTLVAFFYEIANYNLVLYSVELAYNMWITDDVTQTRTDAEIVAIGLWAVSAINMSNIFRFGVDSPPVTDLSPEIPMQALTTTPTNTDYTHVYILAQPTGWFQDQDGDMIPAYGTTDQTITNSGLVPSTVCGGPPVGTPSDGYSLILGPVGWDLVPGSPRSDARVPFFTSVPVERTAALSQIPSQMVGVARQQMLVNPKGFKELVSGSGHFTPYW